MPDLRVAAALCGAVLVGAVVFAWLQDQPDLDAGHAREFTMDALHDAGFDDVRVAPVVRPQLAKVEGGTSVPVWVTEAAVAGGTIELWVDQASPQAVQVTARPDTVLDEDAFRALDDYSRDTQSRDRVERNATITAAGAVGVLIAGGLFVEERRRRR